MSAKWYILRVKVNAEESTLTSLKVALDNLKNNDKEKISSNIHKFEILKKEVSQFRRGKKVTKNLPVYPGYILVNAEMNNEIVNFIRNNYFGSFLSVNKMPAPITEEEYNKMVEYSNSVNKSLSGGSFAIGSKVKISSGSFSSMDGTVKFIDDDKKELKLIVPIFGQDTEIDVSFKDVTIID